MRGCSSNRSALHIEFNQSANQPLYRRLCYNSKPLRPRFSNESGPCSVAPDWGNHGCFLFLRWVICLSSAGSPATLRSVNQKGWVCFVSFLGRFPVRFWSTNRNRFNCSFLFLVCFLWKAEESSLREILMRFQIEREFDPPPNRKFTPPRSKHLQNCSVIEPTEAGTKRATGSARDERRISFPHRQRQNLLCEVFGFCSTLRHGMPGVEPLVSSSRRHLRSKIR